MKNKNVLRWILCYWQELLAGTALALACTITFLNVIIRYFFKSITFVGAEEFVTVCMSWVIFIGTATVYKRKMLFGVDVLVRVFPKKIQKMLDVLADGIVFIVSSYAAYLGWIFANNAWIRRTATLRIPYFFMDIPVCICFSLLAYYSLKKIILRATNRGDSLVPEEEEEGVID